MMIGQPSHVVVALSSGLDSSLAAALLKMAGWKVYAVHFLTPATPSTTETRKERLHRLAEFLDIPLEIIDLRKAFERMIINPFINAYLRGLTPNPCVRCNQLIKFEYLLRFADTHHIGHLATGHYVTLNKRDGDPSVELWRGRDRSKDQSYFVHRVGQGCLSRCIFPLGHMTKKEARQKASQIGLPVDLASESQEICFIDDKAYHLLVEEKGGCVADKRGKIFNTRGDFMGEHSGVHRYTIGQRHGLGIASFQPYYVKEIRWQTNELVVGRREEIYSSIAEAQSFHWISGMPPVSTSVAEAQVRYRHRAAPGLMEIISPSRVRFNFDEPQWAITPGQALVCYEGDRVLGGGWIS
jgi:tRNA-specific 2-thiouridylase